MRLLFIFSIGCLLASCSAEHDGLSSTQGFTKNPSPNPAIVAAAKTTLETNCLLCHSTVNGTNTRFLPDDGSGNIDMDTLIDNTRYIQLGVPLGSSILTYFSSMPVGSALGINSTEGDTISAWVSEMGISSGSSVTFSQVWTATLEPKCLDCHASDAVGGPAGTVSFDDYADLIGTLVVPGSSSTSLIVDSVTNRMPKETRGSTGKVTDPGHMYFVSSDELQDLIDWIDGGALNN